MPERAEGAPPRSVVDVEVGDVGEVHQQAVRAPTAVFEVDLLESFGHDVLELLLGGSGGMCVEEPCRVGRGQALGDGPQPRVVGGAWGWGEPEAGPGVDDDAAGRGGLPSCPLARPGLPPFADLAGEPFREVAAGLLELSGEVALDGTLGDAEQVGLGLGALGLLDQVFHLLQGRLRQGAGEVCGVGLVEAVGVDPHRWIGSADTFLWRLREIAGR